MSKLTISLEVAESIAGLLTGIDDWHYLPNLADNANDSFAIEGGGVFRVEGEHAETRVTIDTQTIVYYEDRPITEISDQDLIACWGMVKHDRVRLRTEVPDFVHTPARRAEIAAVIEGEALRNSRFQIAIRREADRRKLILVGAAA